MHVKYSGASPISQTGTPPSSFLQRTKTNPVFWYLDFNLFFFFFPLSSAANQWQLRHGMRIFQNRSCHSGTSSLTPRLVAKRFQICEALDPRGVWSSHCWVSLIKKKRPLVLKFKKNSTDAPFFFFFFGSVQLNDVSLNSLSVVYSAKGLFCVLAERSALRMWTKAMLLLTWG